MKMIGAYVLVIGLGLGYTAWGQSCPAGFQKLGTLDFETNAENGNDTKVTALTPGFVPDQSYQQQSIKAAGGGSDTTTNLTALDVPAGFHLIMSGSESSCKGWSVSKPVTLTAVKITGAHVDQFGFAAHMYCTTGSGETCKFKGGCNADVLICGKPAPSRKKATSHKTGN